MEFDIFNVIKEGLIYAITPQNTFGAGSIMVLACSISLFVKTVLPDPEGPATKQVKGCFSFRVMTRLNGVHANYDYLY